MKSAGWATVNGKRVRLEYVEPDRPFMSNPQAQQTVLTIAGLGLGAYQSLQGLVSAMPNPNGDRVKRSLPWAIISAAGWFAAPHCGRLKLPIQAGAGISALKAAYEYFRRS